MTEDIRLGNVQEAAAHRTPARRFIPMQVGEATVYVEDVGEPASVETDEIRPVSPPSPSEAFEKAGEILRECVRVLGDRISALADQTRPNEITVEFSLNFEVKGKASVIPIFVTGETGVQTGLKVTAVWKRPESSKELVTNVGSSNKSE